MKPYINQVRLTELLSKITDDPQLCREDLTKFIEQVAEDYAIQINKATGRTRPRPETTNAT